MSAQEVDVTGDSSPQTQSGMAEAAGILCWGLMSSNKMVNEPRPPAVMYSRTNTDHPLAKQGHYSEVVALQANKASMQCF